MSDEKRKSPELSESRYQLLRQMAVGAASGTLAKDLVVAALEQSLALSGVEAGTVTFWGGEKDGEWSVTAGDQSCTARLVELEKAFLAELRSHHGVRSLYMTLDRPDGPAGVFTYPLRAGETIYGAISGLARGERNLALEEEFISGFAAVIALAVERQQFRQPAAPDPQALRDARATAVAEVAVAINHEINNPLTAISGNLQLLLSRAQGLSPDVVRLLKKIEEGADRILEVTRKLRNLTADKTVPYLGETRMIDLNASSEPPKKDTP